MAEPALTVIIVTYNSRDEIDACLRSLYGDLKDGPAQVIVVDNASTDGTAAHIQEHWPRVTLVASAENRGFAAANNMGLARAAGDNILLLNPDTVLRPGAMASLQAALATHPEAAVVGPRLINPDESSQPSWRSFPSLLGDLIGMTELYRVSIARRLLSRWLVDLRETPCGQFVDWLSGACLLVRRTAIEEVGRLDEGFFMYSEEMEWQYRMAARGWRVWLEPSARVVHLGGASTARFSGRRIVWQYQSIFRFYHLHRTGLQRLGLRFILWVSTWPKIIALVPLSRGHPRRHELLRAFWRVLWLS